MNVNIYGLMNPINKKIFYVGATNNTLGSRLCSHLNGAKVYDRNGGLCKKRMELIMKLIKGGKKPKIILLKQVPMEMAGFYEKHYYHVLKSMGCELLQVPYGFEYDKKMKAWDLIMKDRNRSWYKKEHISYYSSMINSS